MEDVCGELRGAGGAGMEFGTERPGSWFQGCYDYNLWPPLVASVFLALYCGGRLLDMMDQSQAKNQ